MTDNRTLLLTWIALLVLLSITAGSSRIDLGWANVTINLAAAAAKALLIMLFFMQLSKASTLTRLAAGAMVLWLGMPRRYHTYPPEFQIWHVLSSAGAALLAIGYLMPLFYLGWSLFRGGRAPGNPWGATGLEWKTASPPPPHNFREPPVVTGPPYAYPLSPETNG